MQTITIVENGQVRTVEIPDDATVSINGSALDAGADLSTREIEWEGDYSSLDDIMENESIIEVGSLRGRLDELTKNAFQLNEDQREELRVLSEWFAENVREDGGELKRRADGSVSYITKWTTLIDEGYIHDYASDSAYGSESYCDHYCEVHDSYEYDNEEDVENNYMTVELNGSTYYYSF